MRFIFTYIFICISFLVFAQNNIFDFSNLSFSSRSSAMGGDLITIYDNDINISSINPSYLNAEMQNTISLSFVDYYSDINYFSTVFSSKINKIGPLVFGFFGINYGSFVESDEIGNVIGDFHSGEYMFSVGGSKKISDKLHIGANLKILHSNLYNISATALSSDLSSVYNIENASFTILFKNIGRTVKNYSNIDYSLPFKIQIGAYSKLKHLPLAFSLVYNNLQDFNHLSSNLNNDLTFFNKLFSHIIMGWEFGQNRFKIRGGYNVQRRYELKNDSYMGFTGFSWGVGIKLYNLEIDYSRSTYHIYGSPNYFTISTSLNNIFKKYNGEN